MSTPFAEEPETTRLLERVAGGDGAAAGALLDRHRDRLALMVRLRLDRRVRGRVGVSDVIQEVYLEASQRLDEYFRRPDVPFYIWLRFIAAQRVLMLHRRHIRAKGRAIGRERPLYAATGAAATSVSLAAELVGRGTSPSRAAVREEVRERLAEALESMEPIDREVLALRHFEELSNVDSARVLGIETDAASKRYVRALRRLRAILAGLGLHDEARGPRAG